MVQASARVIDGGRVTIPAHLREDLGITKGDYVVVDIRPLEGGTNGD